MAAYELAFRMQSAAPDAVDLSKETPATKQLHGIGDPLSDDFGHKCLLARRLVERCVRFVQLYSGTQTGDDWDNAHTDLVGSHTKMCAKTDKPIAALLADLKARGLLASTLVAASLAVRRSRRARSGATITPYGLTTWMAGGGIKGGQSHR